MQNAFPKLSDTRSKIGAPAPAEVVQHNDEVCRRLLGMDEAELHAPKKKDAI
jgi:hypothetical protein